MTGANATHYEESPLLQTRMIMIALAVHGRFLPATTPKNQGDHFPMGMIALMIIKPT